MALVIYDLDHTLLNEDSSRQWIRFLVDKGFASKDILNEEARLDRDYQNGTLDMHEYLLMQLGPHVGKPLEQATKEVDDFIDEYVAPHFRLSAIEDIQHHQKQGNRCLVISATVDFLVIPIAKRLGINDAIGVEIEVKEGLITGKAKGVLSYADGKVTRLEQWLKRHNEDMQNSWFYSDSHNDLPLLDHVTHPVAVSPDDRLRAIATERQWSLLEWHNP